MMSLKAKIPLFNRMDRIARVLQISLIHCAPEWHKLFSSEKIFLHVYQSILYEGQAPLIKYPRAGIAPQTLEKLTAGAIFAATIAITGVISTIQFRGSSCTNCHYLRPFTDAVVI